MEFTGQLIEKLDVQSGTSKAGKQWSKMNFILQQKGVKFENKIACSTFRADVIQLISDTSIGADVQVYFQPKSREWNGKWFTDIDVYKVEINKQTDSPVTDANDHAGYNQMAQMAGKEYKRKADGFDDLPNDDDDGLPF